MALTYNGLDVLEQGYQNTLQSPDYYKGLWTANPTTSTTGSNDNWFQKLGGWKGVGGAAAALGTTIGNARYGLYDYADPTYWMADGRESAVGNTMNGVGVGLFQAGVQTGNPMLMAIGGGAKAIGGLWNSAFGKKWNKDNIAKLDGAIAGMNSSARGLASSTSNNSLLDNWNSSAQGFDFGKSYIGKDGWFTHGVSRKFNEYQNKMAEAGANMMHAMNTGVENINKRNRGTIYNSSAYGGPIDTGMSAVDYNFMSDWLAAKKDKPANNGKIGFTGYPGLFAYGGGMHNHGADWSNGAVHINAGGSHEENPNEGVQIGTDREGTPNLVEEGEVIYNDYVYSNRIEMDNAAKERFHINKKRDITYADMAKKIEKESEERPNDPISKKALDVQMAQLAEEQERQKQEQKAAEAQQMFASLSPEEQIGLMQQLQAEEQAMTQGMQGMPVQAPVDAGAIQGIPMGQTIPAAQPMIGANGGKLFEIGGDTDEEDETAGTVYLPNVNFVGQYPNTVATGVPEVDFALAMQNKKKLDRMYSKLTDTFDAQDKLDKKVVLLYGQGGDVDKADADKYEAWLSGFNPYYQWLYRTLGITDDEAASNMAGGFSDILEKLKDIAERDEYKDASLHAILDSNRIPYGFDFNNFLSKAGVYDSRFADITPEQWRSVYNAYKDDYDAFSRAYPTIPYALRYDKGYNGQWDNSYLAANADNAESPGNAAEVADAANTTNAVDAADIADATDTQVAENSSPQEGADGRIRQRWVNGAIEDIDNEEREIDLPETSVTAQRRRLTATPVTATPVAGPSVSPVGIVPDLTGVKNASLMANYYPWWDRGPITYNPNGYYEGWDKANARMNTVRDTPLSVSIAPYFNPDNVQVTGNEKNPKKSKNPGNRRFSLYGSADMDHSLLSNLRYAPAVGGLVGLAYNAFKKPDYSRAQEIKNYAKSINPMMISADYNPIYRTYRPMDPWRQENTLIAASNGTGRVVGNVNSPSRGVMQIANGYNLINGLGNAGIQGLMYNDNLAGQVATHNSGENKTLAQLGLQAQAYNQYGVNNAQRLQYEGIVRGNTMMDDIDARRNAAINANLTNFVTSLGNIGEEAYDFDRINYLLNRGVVHKAYGGSINKRKKK